jgi:protein-tyrosine phosphatase
MFNFFKKSPKSSFQSALKVDMHSHLIPGIDDGSPTMETTISFLKEMNQLGFQKVITTPHIMSDFYPNTSSIILDGLASVKAELLKSNLPIKIEAAAEYLMDYYFEKLVNENDILCFGTEKYVLVELSFVAVYPNFEKVIFELLTKGYQPILAHPERYNYLHNNYKTYAHIRDLGCMMQINIPSLLGYYGKPTKLIANRLIKDGLIDFLGTDLHHDKHLQLLKDGSLDIEMSELIAKYNFKNESLL